MIENPFKQFKEFFIGISNTNTPHVNTKRVWSTDYHVIEYSAYEELHKKNEKLKYIIRETLWMARRYANNRSTFAPTTFNECVHLLDELGLSYLYQGDENGNLRFADDGMLGKYNPEVRKFEKEINNENRT